MSRVDDDREAQRAADRLMLKRQEEQKRTKEKDAAESAFAKLISEGQEKKAKTSQRASVQQKAQDKQYADHDHHLRDEVPLEQEQVGAEVLGDKSQAKDRGRSADRRAKEGKVFQLQKDETLRQGDRLWGNQANSDRALSERREGAFQGDAGAAKERLEDRGKPPAQAGRQKGDQEVDRDGGGGKKGGGGNKDQKGQGGGEPGFRLNPALMAPVPIAKPKENPGSSRLRALANEIAQKIVERVRVGTNAAGMAEFQIDLRSNVLSGLSIRISGSNGRVKALFSGPDRDVLKQLEEQSDGLKAALAGRGITLEELKIERRV